MYHLTDYLIYSFFKNCIILFSQNLTRCLSALSHISCQAAFWLACRRRYRQPCCRWRCSASRAFIVWISLSGDFYRDPYSCKLQIM